MLDLYRRNLHRLMGKKKKKFNDYSTDSSWSFDDGSGPSLFAVDPAQQRLRIRYERKGRGGKEVTLVVGYMGSSDELKDLCKTLQKAIGTGGSAKDGEIVLQGKHVEKVKAKLISLGYTDTRG